MAERWINESRQLLKALEELASKKSGDRLELVNEMLFAINTIDRSIHGWRTWIQNLQVMSTFSEDELREMRGGLVKGAQSFIEFDVQVSEKYREKFPGAPAVRAPHEGGRAGIV